MLGTTTDCKNKWIESDGFCTWCGQNHWEKKTPRFNRKLTVPKKVSAPRIETFEVAVSKDSYLDGFYPFSGELDDMRRYCERLFFLLKTEYPLIRLETQYKPHTRRTYHTTRYGDHRIVFGWKLMRDKIAIGEDEYKSIQWVIGYRNLKGWAAVHHVVLHEFAHALQTEPGYNGGKSGRKYNSVHNDVFIKWLRELMTKFPYILEV